MTREHVTNAIEELRAAREYADFGTALMIKDEIERLENLRHRFDNINDE